jgi:hypothetical protein
VNRSHVTLPQILVAASTRHAHMVPESAGYLILALCEAIGCLPLAVPDSAIELSAEGAVAVTQQGKVLPGPEASQTMRELFTRLLAVTAGPTPRLAAVARPRELSAERGVDTLAAEIEAALVPMNRSAGKRSLGRLARETLRAIESGTLALHLQARAAAKEAPDAVNAAMAPLLITPLAPVKPQIVLPISMHLPPPPLAPITPPPFMTGAVVDSDPFAIPVTPTTPGLGLDTVATEAHVDSGVFGATPTYREGADIAVQSALPNLNLNESPGFESTNIKPVSCDPTQLSAREVQLDPAPKTPRSDDSARAVSTKRRVRRAELPRPPQEITLASAGVEPVSQVGIETPAPSAPDNAPQIVTVQEFIDCHDGQTQSAPKYNETLPGLAPVTPAPSEPAGPSSAEPLESCEYILVTPSALPRAVTLNDAPPNLLDANENSSEPEELLSSELLRTATPSRAIVVAPNAAEVAGEAQVEQLGLQDAFGALRPKPQVEGFQPLDAPSEEPGRVDELLGKFGRPEEGEDEMLRKTASQLKELAGLEATPCVPSVSPAIRVPVMTNRATPAWLPEDPRQALPLEPAPLVQNARNLKQKLAVPIALAIALCAGFAVVHWRLPEVVLRWVRPVEAHQPSAPPTQAAADQNVYVEP